MTEIHGHRGFRGRFPENTIPGFLAAADAGATALELDVVLSQDGQLVVSHEPWMNPLLCLTPQCNRILPGEDQQHNLFRMPYSQIARYYCGSLPHPDFPEQTPFKAHKPLLRDVIVAVEAHCKQNSLSPLIYNVEVKSEPAEVGLFYPEPKKYAAAVQQALQQLPQERWLVQSFDAFFLQQLHALEPGLTLGLLIEEPEKPEMALQRLGFVPDYYNPHYSFVTPELVDFCRQQNLKLVPWTVNDRNEMLRLLSLGVSGLISDFPDLAVKVVEEWERSRKT